MTTMIGNRKKPWRGYGGLNTLHAIRLHVRQDGLIDPAECKGTVSQLVLQPNKNFHVGTIPAGAFIMAPSAEVITAFAAGGDVSLGTEEDIDGLVTAAELGAGAVGYKNVMAGGPLLGYVREDLYIYARLAAASDVGELDVVIPFYTNAD
jgi:hypothetical protein